MSEKTELQKEAYADTAGRHADVREIIASVRRHSRAESAAPEWGGIGEVQRIFGFSRPRTFKLIALGLIESVHIKEPGRRKGVRLVSFESVRRYISTFAK